MRYINHKTARVPQRRNALEKYKEIAAPSSAAYSNQERSNALTRSPIVTSAATFHERSLIKIVPYKDSAVTRYRNSRVGNAQHPTRSPVWQCWHHRSGCRHHRSGWERIEDPTSSLQADRHEIVNDPDITQDNNTDQEEVPESTQAPSNRSGRST